MSRNDWEVLRDKGPQIEERERLWKKKPKKKPFAIEYRYCGQLLGWSVYRRYTTEKQCDEALRNLRRNNWYEYRKQAPT